MSLSFRRSSLFTIPPSLSPLSPLTPLAITLSVTSALLLLLPPLLRRLLRPSSPSRPILLSLPYSHYVELARWSLIRASVDFVELKLPIGPHLLVGVYRLLFDGGTVSSSSFPGDATAQSRDTGALPLLARAFRFQPAFFRRLAGVPALVRTDPETLATSILPDSWSILNHAGLSISPAFRGRLDESLGPAVRRLAYTEIFRTSRSYYRAIQGGGFLTMLAFDLFDLFGTPLLMRSLMDLTPTGAADASNSIASEFAHVSEILEKTCLPFLGEGEGGTAFGGGDLAFSALAGWIVLPPNFQTGGIDSSLCQPENFLKATAYIAVRERARDEHRRAWDLVVKCYETERVRPFPKSE